MLGPRKPKIYLSNGLGFSKIERATALRAIQEKLAALGYDVCEPFAHLEKRIVEKEIDPSQPDFLYQNSQQCKRDIEGCDLLLVVTIGQSPDVGAMVEAGYAVGLGKPVCYFHDTTLISSDSQHFRVDSILLMPHTTVVDWERHFYTDLLDFDLETKALAQYIKTPEAMKQNPLSKLPRRQKEEQELMALKPKVYLAHGLGSIDQPLSADEKVALKQFKKLKDMGFFISETRERLNDVPINWTKRESVLSYAYECFSDLNDSDCVLIIANDAVPRSGGMFQLGLAAALKKPAFIYRSNTTRVSNSQVYPMNLMMMIADKDGNAWKESFYQNTADFFTQEKALWQFQQAFLSSQRFAKDAAVKAAAAAKLVTGNDGSSAAVAAQNLGQFAVRTGRDLVSSSASGSSVASDTVNALTRDGRKSP